MGIAVGQCLNRGTSATSSHVRTIPSVGMHREVTSKCELSVSLQLIIANSCVLAQRFLAKPPAGRAFRSSNISVGLMGACTARIAELSQYFDSLADLVPMRHYIDPEEVLDVRHMKKEERRKTKTAIKQQHKLSKLAKLDPDGAACTTSAQRQQQEDAGSLRAAITALVQPGQTGNVAAGCDLHAPNNTCYISVRINFPLGAAHTGIPAIFSMRQAPRFPRAVHKKCLCRS
jgi:hypothetical protein